MRKELYNFLIFLTIWSALCFSQSESQVAMDSLKRSRKLLADLQEQQLFYLQVMDSLSIEINKIKQEDYQTFFKRRRLENLLREFQETNEELYRIEVKLEAVKIQENNWRELVLKEGHSASTESLQILNSHRTKTRTKDQNPELNFDDLVKILNIQDNREAISPIRIELDDTPRQIERKADILKDREDKLRVHAKRIRARINQAQHETELRQRLGDLLDDVTLFDHRDEPISPQRQSSRETELMANDLRSNNSGQKLPERSGTLLGEDLMKANFKEMSATEAEEVIRKLTELLQKVEDLADRLAIEAERFYDAAKSRRNEKK